MDASELTGVGSYLPLLIALIILGAIVTVIVLLIRMLVLKNRLLKAQLKEQRRSGKQ